MRRKQWNKVSPNTRMRELWETGDRDGACAIAAKATPYCHPRLSAIDQRVSGEVGYTATPEADDIEQTTH